MSIQILVTQNQTVEALAEHGQLRMLTTALAAWIFKKLVQIPSQSNFPIYLPQEQAARITGDVPAFEMDL